MLAVGTDTSGVEVLPPKDQLDDGTSFDPVHVYKIEGAAAGTVLRPIGLA